MEADRTSVQIVLKSLVVSSPRGITVERIGRDYKALEGCEVPYRKLGYTQLEAFLRSFPDVFTVNGYGQLATVSAKTEKSAHIQKMVSAQKTPKNNTYSPRPKPPRFQRFPNNPSNSYHWPHNQTFGKAPYQSNTIKCNNNSPMHPPQAHGLCAPPPCFPNSKPQWSPKTNFSNNRQPEKSQNDKLKPIEFRQPVQVSPVSKGRDTTNNNDLPRISDLSINSDNHSERSNLHESEPKEANRGDTRYTSRDGVCETWQNTRFKSEDAERRTEKPTQFVPKKETRSVLDDEALPHISDDDGIFVLDYPENMVRRGQKIPPVEFPASLTKDALIKIFVSEVSSPHKFWFHLHREDNQLESLMADMENFYDNLQSEELLVQRSFILPGQVCAARFNKVWYRAEILDKPYKNEAKEFAQVFLTDYGTVISIDLGYIKYLPTKFSSLSAQAFRGSLSHCAPTSRRWSRAAIYYFQAMITNVLLYGKVTDIVGDTKTVYMILCDTNAEVEYNLTESLMCCGYAVYDPEWRSKVESENAEQKINRKYNYPSFAMLESGDYPSLKEIDRMIVSGIDYFATLDENINAADNEDINEDINKILDLLGLNTTAKNSITPTNYSY